MKNNTLFICKTTWEHFITLIYSMKIYNDVGLKSSIIVEAAEENISYWDKLKKLKCFDDLLRINLYQSKVLKFLLFHYRTNFSLYRKLKPFINNKDCSINLFVDQSVIAQTIFKKNKKVNLFEHGNGNYLVGAYPNYAFIKKLLGVTPGYGRSKYIKSIYLQYPDKAPDDIKNKTLKLDIYSIFESLTDEQKKDIFDIFNIPKTISENGIIILTQPLSEDGFMSEKKKINIYMNVINSNRGRKIYLKPHPREKTDYSLLSKFCSIEILPKSFPIEIFNLTNIRFDTAISICSGSAYNFNYPINISIIGTESFPELIKPLGIVKSQFLTKEKSNSIQYT